MDRAAVNICALASAGPNGLYVHLVCLRLALTPLDLVAVTIAKKSGLLLLRMADVERLNTWHGALCENAALILTIKNSTIMVVEAFMYAMSGNILTRPSSKPLDLNRHDRTVLTELIMMAITNLAMFDGLRKMSNLRTADS